MITKISDVAAWVNQLERCEPVVWLQCRDCDWSPPADAPWGTHGDHAELHARKRGHQVEVRSPRGLFWVYGETP